MQRSHHTLILGIAIVATLGVLGWRMMQPPVPVKLEEDKVDLTQFDARLTQATARIGRINLADVAATIQTNPTYRSLIDFSRPLPNIPKGRENPFAPIENLPEPSGEDNLEDFLEF
ncbi:MAG: hypothetical protein KatS3mg099_416 [Candidatus Parcubacteria bacterium]|nr:MAG: hypothetical protein KatS3mg099_416 [Candidatus Parcubacteria bacterium]